MNVHEQAWVGDGAPVGPNGAEFEGHCPAAGKQVDIHLVQVCLAAGHKCCSQKAANPPNAHH